MVAISTLDIFHSFREKEVFPSLFFYFISAQASKQTERRVFEEREKGGKIESIFPDHPLCLISLELCSNEKVRERKYERQHEDLPFSLFNNITTPTQPATPQSNIISKPPTRTAHTESE
jgi:hypothetical protein